MILILWPLQISSPEAPIIRLLPTGTPPTPQSLLVQSPRRILVPLGILILFMFGSLLCSYLLYVVTEIYFFDSLHYYISFYTIRNYDVIELLLFDNCY